MTAFEYLKETEKQRTNELIEFLSFASVSAQSKHNKDVAACAAHPETRLFLRQLRAGPLIMKGEHVSGKQTQGCRWPSRSASAGYPIEDSSSRIATGSMTKATRCVVD